MRIITKQVPDDFNQFYIGDTHLGIILMDYKGIETMMHMVNSPYGGLPAKNNFVVHTGDHMESRKVDHPYFQLALATETTPARQVKAFIKLFDPIKDKMLSMNMGNHPRHLLNSSNYTLETCQGLGITYGTFASKLIYQTKGGVTMHRAYVTHGKRGINSRAGTEEQRKAAMLKQLKDQLRLKFSDCMIKVKGHTHKLLTCPPVSKLYLTGDTAINSGYTSDNVIQNAGWIHEDDVWYVNSGSFVKLYADEPLKGIRVGPNGEMRNEEDFFVSGYAEEAEYDPMELGFAIARYRSGKLVAVDEVALSGGEVRIRTSKTERREKIHTTKEQQPIFEDCDFITSALCSGCQQPNRTLSSYNEDMLCYPCISVAEHLRRLREGEI